MEVPLEIAFHNLEPSAWIEDDIRARVAKLEKFYERMVRCRVSVEALHKQHRTGNIYEVHIEMHLPNGKLVVSEGAYILEIADAICLPADDESDRVGPTQRIHLTPDGEAIKQALKQHTGKAVSVRGSMFAMHTDDHKAPLVMMTKEVTVK